MALLKHWIRSASRGIQAGTRRFLSRVDTRAAALRPLHDSGSCRYIKTCLSSTEVLSFNWPCDRSLRIDADWESHEECERRARGKRPRRENQSAQPRPWRSMVTIRNADAVRNNHRKWHPAVCMTPYVTGAIGYLLPMPERPYNYMFEPPHRTASQNCNYDLQPMRIGDARSAASSSSVHLAGFELWDAPTEVRDFYDEAEVASTYYAEVAELALQVTGASRVYVFDHVLRRREEGRPALGFGRHGDGSRPAAVGRAHNDYTEYSGHLRLQRVPHKPRTTQCSPTCAKLCRFSVSSRKAYFGSSTPPRFVCLPARRPECVSSLRRSSTVVS